MKILYLSPLGALGGAENVLFDAMTSVRKARPEIVPHLVVGSDGPLVDRARGAGFDVRVLPLPSQLATLGNSALDGSRGIFTPATLLARAALSLPRAGGYLLKLRSIVNEIQPRLIHSNGLKCHLISSLLPSRSSPIIWHVHDFLSSRRTMKTAMRWASRNCSGVIAISNAVARDVQIALPNTPIRIVQNGVNLETFRPIGQGENRAADLDALAGLSALSTHTVRVGLVATYARWKGQDILIDAAAKYVAQHPDSKVRFYIIGGPIYQTRGSQFTESELRDRSSAHGLNGRIGFVPFQKDPRAIYQALDIVVHASTKPEPFGLTIAEAMACARPVIVSQAGGAAELFTHNVDAVGVASGNSTELAAAIAMLANDPQRRAKIADNARRTAVANFDLERVGRQMLEAYGDFAGFADPNTLNVYRACDAQPPL